MVFIGPFEHHSNELPWRESIAEVVVIPEDADGHIDVDACSRRSSRAHADRPLRIGSFSAASNVTGIVTDTHGISALLHDHGALVFWDFAAAGPYVEIDIEPARAESTQPRTRTRSSSRRTSSSAARARPGVLVVRRELLTNSVPDVVGGGTVAYVNPERAPLSRRPGCTARRAAPPRSSRRSAPGSSSSSSRPSAST